MRRLIQKDNLFFLVFVFVFWRLLLFIPEYFGNILIKQHPGYIGLVPWANFDGIHYLSIAEKSYYQYEQAFFPLFPVLISYFHSITRLSYLLSGFIIVYVFLSFSLLLFYKLIKIDYDSHIAKWSVVFLLFFPFSFFLVSLYTESVFLFFMFGSLYFARKQKFLISSLFGLFATATRVVGIFLIPAILFETYIFLKDKKISSISTKLRMYLLPSLVVSIGLLLYIVYLYITYGDPLMFIHSQPAFGAGRSGDKIILLPQVVWRYIKIFVTVPISNFDYWISLLEIFIFSISLVSIYFAYKAKIRFSYLVFSLFSIIFPSLSGTLSSMTRYAIVNFPMFILLAMIKNIKVKILLLIIFLIFEIILTSLFLRGYFIG